MESKVPYMAYNHITVKWKQGGRYTMDEKINRTSMRIFNTHRDQKGQSHFKEDKQSSWKDISSNTLSHDYNKIVSIAQFQHYKNSSQTWKYQRRIHTVWGHWKL